MPPPQGELSDFGALAAERLAERYGAIVGHVRPDEPRGRAALSARR